MKQLILFSGVLAGLAMAGTTVSAATTDPTANTKANVQIIDDETDDQLTITSAPDFDFGTVKALDIYNGFDASAKVDKALTISDGRRQEIKGGWTLSTTLSAFANGDDKLNTANLTLSSDADVPAGLNLAGQLETDKATTVLSRATGRGTLTLPKDKISAQLVQSATPNASVAKGAKYAADLTWTLTPDVETRAL